MNEIDWKEQWALHAPNFNGKCACVNLQEYGGPLKTFQMQPGPGFGDLSHPTTCLMLNLMPTMITSEVVDIGCGSGVLSFAAHLRGAPYVYALDIDCQSLLHAQKNAHLNKLNKIYFTKKLTSIPFRPLILMNMISSEQKKAWNPLFSFEQLIISGIPIQEKERFLQTTPDSYGKMVKEKISNGWVGFIFEKE